MKHLSNSTALLLTLMVLPLVNSCEKEPDDFSNSEPVTYYLSYNETLSLNPGPDGGWMYITNYIYPTNPKSCEWTVHLDHNITKDEFGYDLLLWSATEAMVKMDIFLVEGTKETLLMTRNLSVPYISESSAVQHHVDIVTNPFIGTNPKSGKDGDLILRITHMSGEDNVEILYDAAMGSLGCSSITVFQDK